MWSVGTILTGLLSFMYDSQATTGSITSTKADKQRLAKESLQFNVKNPTFRKLFQEWVELHNSRQAAAEPAPCVQDPSPLQPSSSSTPTAQKRDTPPPTSSYATYAVVAVVLALGMLPLINRAGWYSWFA